MVQLRSATATSAALICAITLAGPTAAQGPTATVATVRWPATAPVPDGRDAAVNRASALFALIRDTYDSPQGKGGARAAGLLTPLTHADAPVTAAGGSASRDGDGGSVHGTAPLPLPPDVWIDAVFGGRTTPDGVLSDVLRSRDAALLYYGLFWLDDETRAWFAGERALVTVVAAKYAPRFTLVAPAFRVSGGSVRVPGGDAALAGWEALVGASAGAPSEFLQALLTRDNGRLAYFFGAVGQLPDARLRLGLDLTADRERRGAAVGRLYRVFERLARNWSVDAAPFWRPSLDPALLLSDLAADDAGTPSLPGTVGFWKQVLERDEPSREPVADADVLTQGEPIDVPTLCELIAQRDEPAYHRAHHQVLFASRIVRQVTPASARDAVDAIRAAGSQPALVGTLERAGVRSVSLFARAARRAAELSRIGGADRAARSLRQFQGALFVLTRAALRGSVATTALEGAVDALVAVPISADGDYEGRMVPWLTGLLGDRSARATTSSASASDGACQDPFGSGASGDASPDVRLLQLLAGRSRDCPVIEWEGTRYRVDLAWAEGTRLLRLLGDDRRPYVAAAVEAVRIADALSGPALDADRLRGEAAALGALVTAAPWEPEIRTALRDAAIALKTRTAQRTAAALRLVGDDLLAHGLATCVYAASLGQPDRVLVSASEAAARHDFGLARGASAAASGEWRLPLPITGGERDWRMAGSLLGMDVSLADYALTSVSMRPPSRTPTMGDRDRRVFVDAVALTEPAALDDADARLVSAALRRGQARVAAIRTGEEAEALATDAGFSAARRTLLSWTVAHEPDRVAAAFAPIDLFWLGLEGAPPRTRLEAWGAPAGPRTGCLCLSLDAPRPWEVLAGRGPLVATAFPDLKLKLAALLVELHMPARLLAPVLAAATLDFVSTSNPRGGHDRRALERYVTHLGVDQLEQYLALLTTGGALVPLAGDATPAIGADNRTSPRGDAIATGGTAGPSGARP